jgi:hypothetical protein
VDYRGTAAYEVTLRADRPHEGLIVDKETLRPVAAVYRSADLKATSRLFAVGPGRRGC